MPTNFLKIPDMLNEAAESESFNFDSTDIALVKEEFETEILNKAIEIPDNIVYSPESVLIWNTDGIEENLVEMSDLLRYMESNDITDVAEAFENIAEANSVDASSLALLIESDEYFEDAINEAKTSKATGIQKRLKEIKNASNFLKNSFNHGIKAYKKKSKKPFKVSLPGVAKKSKKK